MQIPRGFEMMAQSVIKMLGLDPNKVMGAIDGMHAALQNVAADLRMIRNDQKRIMAHLGLEEQNDERALREFPGQAGGSEAVGNAGSGT